MATQISLKELAEKLNGSKYWEKGDLKRIYLDEGYNTKKMSTKTFIWQDESGSFKVSCKVECPSQPWQWCKSQEDEVKASVESRIEYVLSNTCFIMTNDNGDPIDEDGEIVALNYAQSFLNEKDAIKELDNYPNYKKYITMPRDEFEAEVERLDEIERPELERKDAERRSAIEAENAAKERAKKEETITLKESGVIPSDAARVRHGKFGEGTVVKSDVDTIEVLFDNVEIGLKKLMTRFVKLEII